LGNHSIRPGPCTQCSSVRAGTIIVGCKAHRRGGLGCQKGRRTAPMSHVGVSSWGDRQVDTIIKGSSCQATEHPSCDAEALPQGPHSRGAGAGQEEGSASRKHCLQGSLPGPVEAAPWVKHNRGEVHPHSATGVGALPDLCSPMSFRKVAALPRRGRPVAGFVGTMVRSTARSRLPSNAFSKTSAGRRPFPETSNSRSCLTRASVRTWQWKD